MADRFTWGSSNFGTGGPPPAPEHHSVKPRCSKCGGFGDREFDGAWFCFRHYEEVSGRRWDAP